MPQIIVDISAEGEVKVEAQGVAGAGCKALTAAIEKAIGATTSDVKKPEFHQATKVGARTLATQGN